MKNPFPKPDPNDPNNIAIINWIQSKIQVGLKFHDCLEQMETLINQNKPEMARIAAYYATNMLINNKLMSDHEKVDVIMGIQDQIKLLDTTK